MRVPGNAVAGRRYVALTTDWASWWVVIDGKPGEDRLNVAGQADRIICGEQWGKPKTLRQDTLLKNLIILSYSAAKRAFPREMRHREYQLRYSSYEV